MEEQSVEQKDREVQHYESASSEKGPLTRPIKYNKNGIELIPQVGDDPNDPYNWSKWKKHGVLLAVTLCGFVGTSQANANGSSFAAQGADWNVTPTQVSYSLSATVAGLCTGPFFWQPIAMRFGNAPAIFWGSLMMFAYCIWAAVAQSYLSFVISRLFCGFACSVASCLGSKVITEMYFLHERGSRISLFTVMFLSGTRKYLKAIVNLMAKLLGLPFQVIS